MSIEKNIPLVEAQLDKLKEDLQSVKETMNHGKLSESSGQSGTHDERGESSKAEENTSASSSLADAVSMNKDPVMRESYNRSNLNL